jgi:hypothetical protein
LNGYHHVFYAMVFFPAGCILGLGWRKLAPNAGLRVMVSFLGVLVVPVLFELCLAFAGDTSVWPVNIALSALLILASAFWVSADSYQPGNRNTGGLAAN